MKYLIFDDEQSCRDLSRGLYRLSVPDWVSAGHETLFLFSWRKHPNLPQWALEVIETCKYARHKDVPMMLTAAGDPYGSQALMQSLFLPIAADGANSLQALTQYIVINDVIDIAQLLAHVNPAIIKTHAEMDIDGWFPNPGLP
jgi:hypothetical protein